MTAKQILLSHIHNDHRRRPAKSWTKKQMEAWHAEQHYRYNWSLSHYHEHDGKGALAGPNTIERRPSGWYSGEGVIVRTKENTNR